MDHSPRLHAVLSVSPILPELPVEHLLQVMGGLDHCPGPYADIELVHGQYWPGLGGVPPGFVCLSGVGPVAAPLLNLRLERPSISPAVSEEQSPSEWQPSLEIDLDGDGQADLERVERCDHLVPSGCGEHICDTACSGVRRARDLESRVNFVECSSYIPDVLDCPPANSGLSDADAL